MLEDKAVFIDSKVPSLARLSLISIAQSIGNNQITSEQIKILPVELQSCLAIPLFNKKQLDLTVFKECNRNAINCLLKSKRTNCLYVAFDNDIREYNPVSNKTRALNIGGKTKLLALNEQNQTLFAATNTGLLYKIGLGSQSLLKLIRSNNGQPIAKMVCDPVRNMIYALRFDNTIESISTETDMQPILTHVSDISKRSTSDRPLSIESLALTNDCNYLIGGLKKTLWGAYAGICLWRLGSQNNIEKCGKVILKGNVAVDCLAVTSDDSKLFVGTDGGKVIAFDIQDPARPRKSGTIAMLRSPVGKIEVSDNGNILFAAAENGTIIRRDLTDTAGCNEFTNTQTLFDSTNKRTVVDCCMGNTLDELAVAIKEYPFPFDPNARGGPSLEDQATYSINLLAEKQSESSTTTTRSTE